MKEKWMFKRSWITFYFGWYFNLSYEICGYFDNRPRINLDIIFFNLTLILPFRNKWTDECDPPKWGISIHHNTFWIYKGGKGNMSGGNKWWTMHMPWNLEWVRTSTLLKDGNWFHETKKNRLIWFSKESSDGKMTREKLNELMWKQELPYTYVLKNKTVQERIATISVSEMEWRWNWFKWLSLTKKISKSIDINFSDEVGERTGSWKGGCTGCSYGLLPNETPEECLRRMEKERKF